MFKRPIYKILFYAAWLVVLGGIAALLLAANRKTKSRSCKGVEVSINGGTGKIFVEKEDVLKSITKSARGSVVNKQFAAINLALLEKNLETNPWIRDAEIYFDTKDILHVIVWERVPMARVFTTTGGSFYIDSAGYRLSLIDNYSTRLPVVTGFTPAKKFNAKDSALLQAVKQVVNVISNDPFWNVQVGQIDISPEGIFELTPVIGSHVIRLGSADGVEEKLNRLMVFYKQVLTKVGFTRYSALDVQFDKQIVAVRKGPTSKVDSIQLKKNIEELMRRKVAEQEPDDAAQEQSETVMIIAPAEANDEKKNTLVTNPIIKQTILPQKKALRKSYPKKTTQKSKQQAKKKMQKPKAVMQNKEENGY